MYDANAAIFRKTKTNLASAYKTIFAPNTNARNMGAPKMVDHPKSEYPTGNATTLSNIRATTAISPPYSYIHTHMQKKHGLNAQTRQSAGNAAHP